MKSFLHIFFILLFLNQGNSIYAQSIKGLNTKYYNDSKEERVLYLKDSKRGIGTRNISNYSEEINYISNGVSNVGITYSGNRIYIWWEVCDDLTQSVYEIYQTKGDGHYIKIAERKNNPSNIHIPILYCFNFENKKYENQFLLLYKKYEDGSMAHIITLIIPKETIREMMTKL